MSVRVLVLVCCLLRCWIGGRRLVLLCWCLVWVRLLVCVNCCCCVCVMESCWNWLVVSGNGCLF